MELDEIRKISENKVRIVLFVTAVLLAIASTAPATGSLAASARLTIVQSTIPDEPNPDQPKGASMLVNPGFECSEGTYLLDAPQGGQVRIPNGWQVVFIEGTPWVHSLRMQVNGGQCGGDAHVERIEGEDALAMWAHDLEWTSAPGKPFDAAVYQQVEVTPGTAYSLSGWLISFCGGSRVPSDCPTGNYIGKMLGIDPTGGTDPLADSVVWVENRQNFVENDARVGWNNLRLSVVAEAETITVFGRIRSPFQWHGNHAIIDAFSLVEAPTAELDELPAEVDGDTLAVTWNGLQSEAVEAIPSGRYELRCDVQVRNGEDGEWVPWQDNQLPGSADFVAADPQPHFFRVRARAEQPPDGNPGAWPNHRFQGVWIETGPVSFSPGSAGEHQVFIPIVTN